jgi:DNA-binding transcriptional regulator YiaG
MAFHTQIFIARIEPNPVFAWLISLLIECFLISLAMARKTIISGILIALLFVISVIAASASFVAKNEQMLNQFFTQKRVIEQLQNDLSATQKAYEFGQRYTTKTLQREQQLQDELREVLKTQNGDITLANAAIFFCIVLVVQSVSIYTASTLKQRTETDIETTETTITETLKQPTETTETLIVSDAETDNEIDVGLVTETDAEITETGREIPAEKGSAETLKVPMTVSEIARVSGISKSTVSRYLRGQKVSDDAAKRIESLVSTHIYCENGKGGREQCI